MPPASSARLNLVLSMLCILALSFPGHAQSVQNIPSDPSTSYDQAITVPPSPDKTTKYVAPDVPKGWINWTAYDGKYLSYKLSFVALFDYTAFWQDSNSLAQVGHQRDQWDIRSFRVSIGGKVGYNLPIKYLLSTEYKGLDRPPGAKGWGSTDIYIATALGRPKYGTITFGKTKETLSYEMVGDAANLPHMERLLSPFFTSRNVGVKYFNSIANNRMSVSGGWFNDWWSKGNPYDGSSNHFTARITALPVMSNDGSSYLHLGFAVRHYGATDGTLQLTDKIESNVSSNYLDTGKFIGRSANNYGFEGLANSGPVSFLAEYIYTTTDAPTVGNPTFYGTYLTGSWVITGEHRPYDPSVAYARRVIPQRRFGAWELVGRIGRVDLTDKTIQGGAFNSYSGNVTWWPNRRYRVTAGYGRYDLSRYGLLGTTNQFHGRIQWIY